MATKAEMIHILKRVRSKTYPMLGFDSSGWLIRNTCMLHLYLMHVQEKVIWTSDGCLGGGICRDLQERLGLEVSSHCPTIHSNIYNLVSNKREIKI